MHAYDLLASSLPPSLENLPPHFLCQSLIALCLIFVKFSKVSSPFACSLAPLQILVSYAVVTNVDEYLCGENIGLLSGKMCQNKEYSLALETQQ